MVARVAERKRGTVRRPFERVELAGQRVGELDFALFALLVDNVNLVFAGFVGEERDPATVRRPNGAPFVRAGGLRQVANETVFLRNGENVAASDEERAFAFRAQTVRFEFIRDGNAFRTGGQTVVRNDDRKFARFAGFGVVNAEKPAVFVNDLVFAVARRPANVPSRRVGQLLNRFFDFFRDVFVKVERAVAVRNEVNAVADPHRVAVGARRRRDFGELVRFAVENEEVLRPTAFVTLPVPEVAVKRGVNEALAVRREVARARDRGSDFRRKAAVDRNEVDVRQRVDRV